MEKSNLNSTLARIDFSAMVRVLRDNYAGYGDLSMQERTISETDLDSLLQRIGDVKSVGLNLDGEDVDLIVNIINSYALTCEKLKGHGVTVNNLRKELGIKPRRESLKELSRDLQDSQGFSPNSEFALKDEADENTQSEAMDLMPASEPRPPRNRGTKDKPSGRNGKRSAEDFEKASTTIHSLIHVHSGDVCLHCAQGRLYKYQPGEFIRISGHAPLHATHHISERMRCNACGIYEAASLPDDVLADGEPGQMYGFSARSVMAIHKFLAGHPYHRQETLSEILGCPVAASTAFEQCEKLANDVKPMSTLLQSLASTADHFNIDDTHNKIMGAVPIEKKKRNGKGMNLRVAVFTSLVIATLADEKRIVLYKTNIGHAGEMIDSILEQRPKDLGAPILMSDALSWNKPSRAAVMHSLCMAHARREFCDIFDQYPEQCSAIIQKIDLLFDYDREAKEQGMDPAQRLAWHQKKSLPIMNELKDSFIESMEAGRVERNSNVGGAMGYFLKNYQGLNQFCVTPGAWLHNNLAECILRMVVLGRKNAFFYKTSAGAAVADTIMSVGVTAQMNGVNVFDYFNDIQRYKAEVKKNPENWLPWHYRETLKALKP